MTGLCMLSRLNLAVRRTASRIPLILLAVFCVWFVAWAIKPVFLHDFVLEHILTVVLLVFLIATYRSFRLSNFSYVLIFAFMGLHVIGAHYTYSNVPIDEWSAILARWFGVPDFDLQAAFGLTRNHYDRFVHLMFGLLLTDPLRELIVHIAHLRGGWSYGLPLAVMLSFSTAYELIEWGIAMVFAPDVGQAYLGTQGDEWDAQNDMALAALGSIVTSLLIAIAHRRRIIQGVSAADQGR